MRTGKPRDVRCGPKARVAVWAGWAGRQGPSTRARVSLRWGPHLPSCSFLCPCQVLPAPFPRLSGPPCLALIPRCGISRPLFIYQWHFVCILPKKFEENNANMRHVPTRIGINPSHRFLGFGYCSYAAVHLLPDSVPISQQRKKKKKSQTQGERRSWYYF